MAKHRNSVSNKPPYSVSDEDGIGDMYSIIYAIHEGKVYSELFKKSKEPRSHRLWLKDTNPSLLEDFDSLVRGAIIFEAGEDLYFIASGKGEKKFKPVELSPSDKAKLKGLIPKGSNVKFLDESLTESSVPESYIESICDAYLL